MFRAGFNFFLNLKICSLILHNFVHLNTFKNNRLNRIRNFTSAFFTLQKFHASSGQKLLFKTHNFLQKIT